MKKGNPLKTAILRIAEKIDYLDEEMAEVRGRHKRFESKLFPSLKEELEELLKEII